MFPTFDDCFLLTNMSHYDVITRAFADAVRRVGGARGAQAKSVNDAAAR